MPYCNVQEYQYRGTTYAISIVGMDHGITALPRIRCWCGRAVVRFRQNPKEVNVELSHGEADEDQSGSAVAYTMMHVYDRCTGTPVLE